MQLGNSFARQVSLVSQSILIYITFDLTFFRLLYSLGFSLVKRPPIFPWNQPSKHLFAIRLGSSIKIPT